MWELLFIWGVVGKRKNEHFHYTFIPFLAWKLWQLLEKIFYNLNYTVMIIAIICLLITNISSLAAVYFLRKDVRQLSDEKKYMLKQLENVAQRVTLLASQTKISLSLRYEDLQDCIGKCYANVFMYLQMNKYNKKL